MKKSELKSEIKNYIYEILSEADIDPKSGAVVMKKGTNPNDIKKVTSQGIDVELREDEDSTEESYAVILKGGSIGNKSNKPIKIFNTSEEAKEFANRRNKQLSPGEKSYYKMSYNVIKLPKNLNESDEDSTPDDETVDKQAQAAAKKEKIQGPSKFKVPNSEFEDFKTKLKNLVTKIKGMESGEEKTKKMAALKQFIKKPELVKAFKERDVQIDTGGLVGENKNYQIPDEVKSLEKYGVKITLDPNNKVAPIKKIGIPANLNDRIYDKIEDVLFRHNLKSKKYYIDESNNFKHKKGEKIIYNEEEYEIIKTEKGPGRSGLYWLKDKNGKVKGTDKDAIEKTGMYGKNGIFYKK